MELSNDPNISVYSDIDGSDSKQQSKIKNGFAQFIPICTIKENTSYDYSIRVDNDEIGFDVYFVSSISERDSYFTSDFDFNENIGCFAFNKKSYSGTCSNIEKDGGLLIIIPDELKPWLTKVTVNLYEKENG